MLITRVMPLQRVAAFNGSASTNKHAMARKPRCPQRQTVARKALSTVAMKNAASQAMPAPPLPAGATWHHAGATCRHARRSRGAKSTKARAAKCMRRQATNRARSGDEATLASARPWYGASVMSLNRESDEKCQQQHAAVRRCGMLHHAEQEPRQV